MLNCLVGSARVRQLGPGTRPATALQKGTLLGHGGHRGYCRQANCSEWLCWLIWFSITVGVGYLDVTKAQLGSVPVLLAWMFGAGPRLGRLAVVSCTVPDSLIAQGATPIVDACAYIHAESIDTY